MAFSIRKTRKARRNSKKELSFKRQLFFGILRLIGVVVFFIGVYHVTRLSSVTIIEVTIQGGETISHDEVRARINDELQGTYFLIVPKRFIFLYPHDRMIAVLEKIPRLYNVEIKRTSSMSLGVTFEEYIPHALWCVAEKDDVPCYFITTDGYAFAPAPNLVGGTLVRHSIEGIEGITEGVVINADTLKTLDTFIKRTEQELGLRITSLTHKQNKDIEFMVNGGGMIFATLNSSLETTFENLTSILESDEFKHIKPGNFQYIDLRFDNKIFVNEELEKVAVSTTTTETVLPE